MKHNNEPSNGLILLSNFFILCKKHAQNFQAVVNAPTTIWLFFCTFIHSWVAVNSLEFGISLGLGQKHRIWSHVNEHLIKVVKNTPKIFFLRKSIYFSFIHYFPCPHRENLRLQIFFNFHFEVSQLFLFHLIMLQSPLALQLLTRYGRECALAISKIWLENMANPLNPPSWKPIKFRITKSITFSLESQMLLLNMQMMVMMVVVRGRE